ncbi:MAG: hypothetical protein KF850_22410 [Labilithrix sp.]|nr:hypothetical protein [Labilithrix sp.]
MYKAEYGLRPAGVISPERQLTRSGPCDSSSSVSFGVSRLEDEHGTVPDERATSRGAAAAEAGGDDGGLGGAVLRDARGGAVPVGDARPRRTGGSVVGGDHRIGLPRLDAGEPLASVILAANEAQGALDAAEGERFGAVPLAPSVVAVVAEEVEQIRAAHLEQVTALRAALEVSERMRAEHAQRAEFFRAQLEQALAELARSAFEPRDPLVGREDVTAEDLAVARAAHISLMTRLLLPSDGAERQAKVQAELARFFATHRIGSAGSIRELGERYRAAVGVVQDVERAMAGATAVLDAYVAEGVR